METINTHENYESNLRARDDGLWLELVAPSGRKAMVKLDRDIREGETVGIVQMVINEIHAALRTPSHGCEFCDGCGSEVRTEEITHSRDDTQRLCGNCIGGSA